MNAPFRIVLVCMGNICRSPMAAAVLRARLAEVGLAARVDVSSAGTGNWHVGRAADPRAVAALRARGYDADGHRARQFRASWFGQHDLVLALDRENLAALRAMDPQAEAQGRLRLLRSYDPGPGPHPDPGAGRGGQGGLDVPDPYYGGPEGFDHALDLVRRAADGLVAALERDPRVTGARNRTDAG